MAFQDEGFMVERCEIEFEDAVPWVLKNHLLFWKKFLRRGARNIGMTLAPGICRII